jgi:formylglycine-generating enzyme required for sulfatase activity
VAIHGKGMVHRDLKPQNVLLDGDGRVRLADFGLASWREGVSDPGSVDLTVTGDVFGTPAYMAPEQFEDAKTAGPPADVYALGVLLFEGLAGRTPFHATSPQQYSRLHKEVTPPSLDALCSEAPPELRELIGALLEKTAADRPDAERAAAALSAIAKLGKGAAIELEVPEGSLPASWSPTRTPAPSAPGRRSMRGLLLTLLAVLLLALGTGLAWQVPDVRAQFATPEERSAWQHVVEATREGTDPLAIVQAIEDYQAYFGADGVLRAEVAALRQRPVHLSGRDLYLVPELGAEALLVHVPAGAYAIGHPEGDDEDLTASRKIRLNGFLIDRAEVSNRSYRRFYSAWQEAGGAHRCGSAEADHAVPLGEANASRSPEPDGPVIGVSYYDALEYARFYGRWLPTEEQWEVAASYDRQSGKPLLYPWGATEPDSAANRFYANLRFAEWGEFVGDAFVSQCAEAGSYELDRSPFGLLDMAGNAAEWCRGRDQLPADQPVRGGSVLSDQLGARAAARRVAPPDLRSGVLGFRTVLPYAGR